jgi:hypothetical protein
MRVEIIYDGQPYSIGDQVAEAVRAQIEESLRSGEPYWLEAQRGEGTYTPTFLLIVPGVAFLVTDALRQPALFKEASLLPSMTTERRHRRGR